MPAYVLLPCLIAFYLALAIGIGKFIKHGERRF